MPAPGVLDNDQRVPGSVAVLVMADQLAAQGPSVACLQALDETCADIRRLFAHRHHLA